jgi:hypothetical protein
MSNCGQTLFTTPQVDDIEAFAPPRRDTAYDIEDEFFEVLNSKYPGIGYVDTRCDIAFVVSHLQSYQNESKQQDLRELWHLLKYLNRLPHLPLVYKPTSHQLQGYCDASFALTSR